MGNENPYIENHTPQWSKEKVQKDKQRSTKDTHETKDRVTRTPLKTGVNSGAELFVNIYLLKDCQLMKVHKMFGE